MEDSIVSVDAQRQREMELMFLKAENQHLKSNNKSLKSKIRSLSQSEKKPRTGEDEGVEEAEDSDADSQEVLFVTSAVKRQVKN